MIINGSDLFMWISTELVAYSTSYSLNIEMETRPGTNKGSGIYRKALPGMLNISGSVDGLYVFAGGYATLFGRMIDRTPVRLRFGRKDSVTGQVDTTVDFMSADFLITSLELNATDAENATYTASFVYYDGFGSVSGITVPTVITDFASLPTTTTIRMNGNVTSDGGAIVTDRGFVWNTDGNPTMADFHISEGSGTGVYSQLVTGLASGTPYFFRAYATNAAGTSYGFMSTFTTVAEAVPSYFWIAPNGSDTTGDGEFNTPWLTLAHAISQVTTGDTINLKVGTYNLTTQVVLPVGISLRGQGASTIITTSVSGAASPWDETAILLLSSASEGTSGSQSISYLAFNGNSYAGDAAILVYRRSNVEIHHCTFVDFHYYAVRFRGGAIPPTTYATDNSFHDNTVYDCGGPNVSYGNLQIGGQTDMLIYNNDIQQPGRPGTNQEGFPIKYLAGGHLRGLKIYDNILKCNYTGSDDHWHFSIELFGIEGGNEIYGNTCVGTIDYSGYVGNDGVNDDAGYGYAVKIYENTLGCDAPTDFETYGVTFERSLEGGTYIYRNIIRNVQAGLTFSNPSDGVNWRDVYVYYNLIYNIGQTDGAYGGGILLGRLSDTYVLAINNWNFLNNVIADNSAGQATYGIRVRGGTSITYDSLIIRNNIITAITQGDECPIYLDHVNADIVSIENNCFYGSSTNTVVKASCVITSETTQNNITTDPSFVSTTNFHLRVGSGCIGTGIATGHAFITTDYDGVVVGNPPEIGAYEYV